MHKMLTTWGLAIGVAFIWTVVSGCGGEERPAPPPLEPAAPPIQAVGPEEDLFSSTYIPYFQITLAEAELASLRTSPREYVQATIRERDTEWTEVGLRLKGSESGSFRPVDDKPSMTLNTDKFHKKQRIHGMDKLYLNNSVEDERYMTELLCGELFVEAGVPAPRVSYARVNLNGRELGLYVLKEGWDKTFLRRVFEDPNGNLYDGGLVQDIDEPLSKNAGDDSPGQPELDRVVEAAREGNLDRRWQRLGEVVDLERFLSFMAMEVMTTHTDGYCMNRNNYRVYANPKTGRVIFMPHGMDIMFHTPDLSLYPQMEGLLAKAVVEIPQAREAYIGRLSQLLTNVMLKERIIGRIDQLQARIRPVLEEIDAKKVRDHDVAVERLRLDVGRRLRILHQLVESPDLNIPAFDTNGVARLTAWRPVNDYGDNKLEAVTEGSEPPSLLIQVGAEGDCTASWRTNFFLMAGSYRLEGRVRTAGVIARADRKGRGAGLRVSGSDTPRENGLAGDAPWKLLGYDFVVPDTYDLEQVELVCELRANRGSAWFDLSSLQLIRTTP